MGERSGSRGNRKGHGTAALSAALLVGLIAGVWDGVAIVLENPRSFDGAASVVSFLGAAVALSLAAGGAAGAVAALLRIPAGLVLGTGTTLWIFFWVGVRVHVRFFFGEPLTEPAYVAANLGTLLGAVVLGALAGRFVKARANGRFHVAVGAVFAASFLAVIRAPSSLEPVDAASAPPASAPDILFITLDTTRADHLSCYGYPRGTTPAIDRLARRSFVAPYAYAAIPLTNPSHASMFTGRLPRASGVLNNGTALPDSVPTFVPDLARRGWDCAAFVSGIPLKAGLSGLAPGFAVYDDAFSPLERVHPMMTTLALVRVANRALPMDFIERRAEVTCAAAVRWLERSRSPRFLWVHLFDPHSPYDAPPLLRARFAAGEGAWTANGRRVTEWPVADYDAEIRRVDRAVEDLLRAFDGATGGRGVVLLTADHGEGLEQHGELTHGTQLYTEDLGVPFLLRSDDAPVELRDAVGSEPLPQGVFVPESVFRAVVGLASGRGYRMGTQGLPRVFETFAPEGREDQSAVLATLAAGVVGKLIVNRGRGGEETAFDLTRDPGETRPVDASGPEWDALRAAMPTGTVSSPGFLDPETERRLRALGYIHQE